MAEPIGVGINGAGRIGALSYRALYPCIRQGVVRVYAFNDVEKNATPEAIVRYLSRDSVHGKFAADVRSEGGKVIVDGIPIDVLQEKDPAKLRWSERGVQIALDATGAFTQAESEKGGYMDHIKAGAKYVVISAPVKDDVAKTVVLGVNYDPSLLQNYQAISNASCTTNCLAPIVKVLKEIFGVIAGDMITIHAYTNDQKLVDAYHKDPRRARAANNVIPTSTGAAKAIGLIFPDLRGKISANAIAYRVPLPDGSVVDFNVKLDKEATPEMVNEALREAASSDLEGILEFSTAVDFVSGDVIGNPHSSVVDGLLTTTASEGRIKVVSWYDNEWGYSNRTAELIVSIAKHLRPSLKVAKIASPPLDKGDRGDLEDFAGHA